MNLLNILKEEKIEQMENTDKVIEKTVFSLKDNFNEDEYLYLLKLLFKYTKMNDKIHEKEIISNCKYLDVEDFLQEWALVVYSAIFDYKNVDGNGCFVGYVKSLTGYKYSQICKNAHMKVTGSIPKDKRKNYSFIAYDSFESKVGYDSHLDKTILFEEVNKCVDELPEFYRNIIRTMYFSGEKNLTVQETAKALGMKPRSVRYYRGIAFQELYKMGIPNALSLYEEIAEDEEFDFYNEVNVSNNGSNDEYVASNNYWRSHYNYYSYK